MPEREAKPHRVRLHYWEGAAVYQIHEMTIQGHKMVALEGNKGLPGTPVVLIHGLLCSVRFWTGDLLPVLTEQRHWISLSLPGHYPAQFPPGFRADDLTPDLIADLTISVIRQLIPDQPVLLIGHSTGGFSVVNAAAHDPTLAKAVLAVAGFAHGKWLGKLFPYRVIAGLDVLQPALSKAALATVAASPRRMKAGVMLAAADQAAYRRYPAIDAVIAQWYPDFKHLHSDNLLTWLRQIPHLDISTLLPEMAVPVTALAGSRDFVVPPSQSDLIVARVRQGDRIGIHGAGHMVMWERAAKFREYLTSWVAQWAT